MLPTKTLNTVLRDAERKHPASTGELSELIRSISFAVKVISQLVQTAGFKGLGGYTDRINSTGDITHKLDDEADETLVQILGSTGHFGLLVSEERDGAIAASEGRDTGKYVLAFDPLDGSSNIGSNIPIGTIFSIMKKLDEKKPAKESDFLQAGTEIVAAGYAVYGAKTTFVYSCGNNEVHGFTLDPGIGEFMLTEELIRIPDKGKTFSINEGYTSKWDEGIRSFVSLLKDTKPELGLPYSARYVGSLVVDFDRTIKKGGIFLYPKSSSHPKGKLRMLYEVQPLSFIAVNAGAKAIDGEKDILSIVPESIHDRSPFIVGGVSEIQLLLQTLSVR